MQSISKFKKGGKLVKIRNSINTPLQIDSVAVPNSEGVIGLCLCPGKKTSFSYSYWDRDLSLDLAVIKEWGASAVLTLIQDFEFDLLNVQDMGRMVRNMGIKWFHLPIPDGSPPGYRFDGPWLKVSSVLHNILDKNGKIIIHCRCGNGRAGTVAALMLIERGMTVDDAIYAVRKVRPEAIENLEQETYLRTLDQ
jgi:protein-tyrosine phosphatase